MDRRDYFFGMIPTQAEYDEAFLDVEKHFNQLRLDLHTSGIINGVDVVENSPADLTVLCNAGAAIDTNGFRVGVPSQQVVDISTDSLAASTAVTNPPDKRIVDVYLKFKVDLSDPRIDDNLVPLNSRLEDGFEIRRIQGAQAPVPTPPADPLDGSILIARITLIFGQTQIFNASIDLTVADTDVQLFTASDRSNLNGLLSGATQALLKDGSVIGTGDFNFGGFKLQNLANPESATDAATRQFVEARAAGLDTKHSVKAATDVALDANTPAGTRIGKTLTANANGALTVDGVSTFLDLDNDGADPNPFATTNKVSRVLVQTEVADENNGIYAVKDKGSAGTKWVLVRALDADEDFEVTAALYVFSEAGGTNNEKIGWSLQTSDSIVVDTTGLSFTPFTGLDPNVDGTGLVRAGNVLNVVANADGSILANPNDIQIGVIATDAQHGDLGGGLLHPLAVGGGSPIDGFFSGTEKDQLAALIAANLADFENFTFDPSAIAGTVPAVGGGLITIPANTFQNGIIILAGCQRMRTALNTGVASLILDLNVTDTPGGTLTIATRKSYSALVSAAAPLAFRFEVSATLSRFDRTGSFAQVFLNGVSADKVDLANTVQINWGPQTTTDISDRSHNRWILVYGF